MTDEILVYIQGARLSFPHLKEPHASAANATPKYSADFIMDPNDPAFQKWLGIYAKLAGDKWAEHAQTVMQMITNDRKLRSYGYGNEKVNSTTFQPYDGYMQDGQPLAFISANTEKPPQVIKADGTPVDPNNTMEYQAEVRKMYGGCYVNVAVKPWIQENKHGRGVRCDLTAIQFANDGQPFGEPEVDASGMFGAVQGSTQAPPGFGPAPGNAAPAGQPAPPSPPQFSDSPNGAPTSPPVMGDPGLPDFLQPK